MQVNFIRRQVLFLLLFVIFITNLPSLAITGKTFIFPYVGKRTEDVKNWSCEKIDRTPIKLPRRVFDFDLTEAERAFAPNVLKDQLSFWTSPLRIKIKDLSWLIPASAVATALLITDEDFSKALTNNQKVSKTQKNISRGLGYISGYAVSFGLPGFLFLSGTLAKNDRLRETGILQYHALANSFTVGLILQRIFGRGEPYKHKGVRGGFFEGKNSFPSGHAISAWTLATVVAHEYPHKKWVPVLAYSLALVASSARVTGQKHFPSDVFVGAVLGYMIARHTVKQYSKFAKDNQTSNP